ncbi:hypothetical protein HMPREF9004_1079 [Schaalia cardiffensis F0333]|uniref:Uncharacterized protein n=1 Tax=Schaalia cardiffensis F0333 TaxID=888050 RepID=N6XAR5_9ACTO|nr:hypothetical protein HMPREF9004_1079 [Schaalia cardiffensis F0333]
MLEGEMVSIEEGRGRPPERGIREAMVSWKELKGWRICEGEKRFKYSPTWRDYEGFKALSQFARTLFCLRLK